MRFGDLARTLLIKERCLGEQLSHNRKAGFRIPQNPIKLLRPNLAEIQQKRLAVLQWLTPCRRPSSVHQSPPSLKCPHRFRPHLECLQDDFYDEGWSDGCCSGGCHGRNDADFSSRSSDPDFPGWLLGDRRPAGGQRRKSLHHRGHWNVSLSLLRTAPFFDEPWGHLHRQPHSRDQRHRRDGKIDFLWPQFLLLRSLDRCWQRAGGRHLPCHFDIHLPRRCDVSRPPYGRHVVQ